MSSDFHLPDECWEFVFRFLNQNHHRYLEPLSLVSKQFLTITNSLKFSLTICDPTLPFLPILFHRFPNITSLDLTRFHHSDLNALLTQISNSNFHFKSLNLSNHPTIPSNGLRAFSKKIKTLTSLNCSNMGYLNNMDMFLISECFPFLEELDLSFPKDIDFSGPPSDFGVKDLSLKLHKLRKVNLSGNFYINDQSLFHLCKNCEFLEEVVIFDCHFLTQAGIAEAIRERPSLRSLSVTNFARINVISHFISSLVSLNGLTCLDLSCSRISDELLWSLAEEGLPLRKLVLQRCCNYSYVGIFGLLSKCQHLQHLDLQNAEFLIDRHVAELSLFLGDLVSVNVSGCRMLTNSAFFSLLRNCPLLNEIKMKVTDIGKGGIEDSDSLIDFAVNHQVKSLYLGNNSLLTDESIKMFASFCPNLQLLDLSYCCGISEGVVEVLRKCCKIRHLALAFCSEVKLLGMKFEVPKLETLNLSRSRIDDEALHAISKCCCGLLQLDLENCSDVTAKGVRQVVENCTQLREINLGSCYNVAANVVAWMVFSRPTLRKIMAPPRFHLSEGQRQLLLRHGCLVC